MEHFFTPTRRLQDRHDYMFDEPLGYTEVQIAVSIEAFMNHRWDWLAFHAFATDIEGEMWKLMWITEDTLIWVEDENNELDLEEMVDYAIQRTTFTATSGETHELVLATDKESASLSVGASSVFWHAVTTSNCVKINCSNRFGLCSDSALSHFLEASPSLELLEFDFFSFEEAHCRALTTLERTDLEVTFERCSFDPRRAKDSFIEWLRHSQVVTKLDCCTMEDSIISALSGNSSVKSLTMTLSKDTTTNEYSDSHIMSLARALPGNHGIKNLYVLLLNDEAWSLLLRSLWAHPRIQSVRLTFFSGLSAASKTSMMNAVLRLALCNTVVHTIELSANAKDEAFFQNFIVPRLEMNRNCFEDQRQALKRADPFIRGQLLGRALHVVRYNPDLLFRFLSENVPAFVRSDGPIIP
jgi:hypothetical protein